LSICGLVWHTRIETGNFRHQQAFKSLLMPFPGTLHDHWRNIPGFFHGRGLQLKSPSV
jgi:hypothetical protein